MAYEFNGVDQGFVRNGALSAGGSVQIQGLGFVMAARIFPTESVSSTIIALCRDNNTTNRWLLSLTNTAGVLTVSGGATMNAVTPVSLGSNEIPLNQWSDIVLVVRRDPNAGYRLFINGVLAGTGTNSSTSMAPNLTSYGCLAASTGASSFFKGRIAYAEVQGITVAMAERSDAAWAADLADYSGGLSLQALAARFDAAMVPFGSYRFDGRWDGAFREGAGVFEPEAFRAVGGVAPAAYPTFVDTSTDDPRSYFTPDPEAWTGAKLVAFNGRGAGSLSFSGGLGYRPFPHATASAPIRHAPHRTVSTPSGVLYLTTCGSALNGDPIVIEHYSQTLLVMQYSSPDGGKRWLMKDGEINRIADFTDFPDEDDADISKTDISTAIEGAYDIERGLMVAAFHIRTSIPAANTNRVLIAYADLTTLAPGSAIVFTPVFISKPIGLPGTTPGFLRNFSLSLKPSTRRSNRPGEERLYFSVSDYRNNPKDGSIVWCMQFDYDDEDDAWAFTAGERVYENDLDDEGNETDGPGHIHSAGVYEEADGTLGMIMVAGDTNRSQILRGLRTNRDLSVPGSWTVATLRGEGSSTALQGTGLVPSALDGEFWLGSDESSAIYGIVTSRGGDITFRRDSVMWGGMATRFDINYNCFPNSILCPEDGEDVPRWTGWMHQDGSATGGISGNYDRVGLVLDGLHMAVAGVKSNSGTAQPQGVALDTKNLAWIQRDLGTTTGAGIIGRTSVPKVIVARPMHAGGGNTNYVTTANAPVIPTLPATGYAMISGDIDDLLATEKADIPTFSPYTGPVISMEYGATGADDTIPVSARWVIGAGIPNTAAALFKMWAIHGKGPVAASQFGRRSLNGGSSYESSIPGNQFQLAEVDGVWQPFLYRTAAGSTNPYNFGFEVAMSRPAVATQDDNDMLGARIAWFPESVRVGAAMIGDPVTITGFTLDSTETPNPYAIGIMGRIPEAEYDFTLFDQPVILAELINGDDLESSSAVGIRIEIEQPTSGSTPAVIRMDHWEDGAESGGAGSDSANLPYKYAGNDPINILIYRNDDTVTALVSIGGAPPVELSIEAASMINTPPTKIVLHNQQVYGVSVLEDASDWDGLTEDSFESLADAILEALPSEATSNSVVSARILSDGKTIMVRFTGTISASDTTGIVVKDALGNSFLPDTSVPIALSADTLIFSLLEAVPSVRSLFFDYSSETGDIEVDGVSLQSARIPIKLPQSRTLTKGSLPDTGVSGPPSPLGSLIRNPRIGPDRTTRGWRNG